MRFEASGRRTNSTFCEADLGSNGKLRFEATQKRRKGVFCEADLGWVGQITLRTQTAAAEFIVLSAPTWVSLEITGETKIPNTGDARVDKLASAIGEFNPQGSRPKLAELNLS